jgi:hypothetical protein
MELRKFAAAALAIFLGLSTAALANGAVSEFPAGGVVFKPEKQIAILREDLDVSLDRIHVHYVFQSSANMPLTRTIGFPLAKVPQDDSPDGFEEANRNYMAFEVRVNGKPLSPKLHEYGWFGGRNITSDLQRLGVPVFAATVDQFKALAHLPKATVDELKARKLVQAEENGAWLVPQWLYQSVYEWTQTFAPGKTKVDISYKPRFGAGNEYDAYYPGGSKAQYYCLDAATRQKIVKLKADGQLPEPMTVGYILKTARNWRGPIGAFHLTVADKNAFASFCPPDGLKAGGNGKTWHATNFVPKQDLSIVFYYREPHQ